MQPDTPPDPDPPGVFVLRGGALHLNGEPVGAGDSVFDPKFGYADPDDQVPAVQVAPPQPGLLDRVADHADAALLAAAVVLAALLWRKR